MLTLGNCYNSNYSLNHDDQQLITLISMIETVGCDTTPPGFFEELRIELLQVLHAFDVLGLFEEVCLLIVIESFEII